MKRNSIWWRVKHALPEGIRNQASKHNEAVKQHRLVVESHIHIVCLLGKQNLGFLGHFEWEDSVNKGYYLELLDLLSKQEQYSQDHLQSTSGLKGISNDIQKELVQSVTDIIQEKIKLELDSCDIIGIQADETLHVSNKSQVSIILDFAQRRVRWNRFS